MLQHFEMEHLTKFDNLLSLIKSNPQFDRYSMEKFLKNKNDLKIIETINKYFNLAYDIHSDGKYYLTPIGIEIKTIGIKSYIEKLHKDKELQKQNELLQIELTKANIKIAKQKKFYSLVTIVLSSLTLLFAILAYYK